MIISSFPKVRQNFGGELNMEVWWLPTTTKILITVHVNLSSVLYGAKPSMKGHSCKPCPHCTLGTTVTPNIVLPRQENAEQLTIVMSCSSGACIWSSCATQQLYTSSTLATSTPHKTMMSFPQHQCVMKASVSLW